MKGLDRLVEFVSNMNPEISKRIKIHLLGPDYQNGFEKMESALIGKACRNVFLFHPKEIWSLGKYLLAQADYSILLSRWDGFPRALRESIYLSTPVLISEETNFKDFVEEHQCGELILNSNDLERLVSSPKKKYYFDSAKQNLSFACIASKKLAFYREILELTNQS